MSRCPATLMLTASLTLVLGALMPAPASAQSYPLRSVRLIVPVSAGGGMDITARGVAQRMAEPLGQSMVIDNRPGGGGSIGAELTRSAVADGYTLLVASGTLVTHRLLSPASYDPVKDFAAISQMSRQPFVLVVNPAVPATSMAEFIAHARAHPGKLNYSSSGSGSLINLTGELFARMVGVKLVHIPYKGVAASYPDLLSGQVQLTFASTISATPHIRSGKLRALGVTTATRARSMASVPTFAESGVKGFDVAQWYGMLAPAGTPASIIDRLHRAVVVALGDAELIERMAGDGSEPVGSTPAQFAAHIRTEMARWKSVIEQTGIKAE